MQRKIWSPVWLAFIMGCLPLLVYAPLIRSASSYSGNFWAKANAGSLGAFVWFLLYPAAIPIVAVAAGIAFYYLACGRRSVPAVTDPSPHLPLSNVVTLFGYAGLPILAILLAKIGTGAYTHRYALAAVIGLVVLSACLLSRVFLAKPAPALVIAAGLSLFFLAREGRSIRNIGAAYDHTASIRFLEAQTRLGMKVAIADPHLFLELTHQAPPELRNRMFYIADRKLALKHLHTDAVDRGLIDMQPFAPMRIVSMQSAIQEHPRFWCTDIRAPGCDLFRS